MSRSTRLPICGRRNAPDELLAILDVPVVVSGVFVFFHYLPAKEVRIELPCTRLIRRVQVCPAQRPVQTCDSGSHVLLRLPKRELRAGGILQVGHPASIENIKRRRQNLATEPRGLGGSRVGAFDGDVKIPVRRNATRGLLVTKCVGRRGVAPLELENGVEIVWTDGSVLEGPAKNLPIEISSGGLVRGAEFNPAKFSRKVFLDVRHSAECTPRQQNREEAPPKSRS